METNMFWTVMSFSSICSMLSVANKQNNHTRCCLGSWTRRYLSGDVWCWASSSLQGILGTATIRSEVYLDQLGWKWEIGRRTINFLIFTHLLDDFKQYDGLCLDEAVAQYSKETEKKQKQKYNEMTPKITCRNVVGDNDSRVWAHSWWHLREEAALIIKGFTES